MRQFLQIVLNKKHPEIGVFLFNYQKSVVDYRTSTTSPLFSIILPSHLYAT